MERLLIHGVGRSGTTVTQRIVNSCPNVWVTNEFILYDLAFGYNLNPGTADAEYKRNIDTPIDYFISLTKQNSWTKSKEHYWDVPTNFDSNLFIEKCKLDMKKDTIRNRIIAAEKALFGELDLNFFGDKVLNINVLFKLLNINLKYKIIYVYKDGRDNIASRTNREAWDNRPSVWSNNIFKWQKLKKQINPNDYIEIRFEDFLYDPDVNAYKIKKLLKLDDISNIKKEIDKRIDGSKIHIGHYKKIIPNWQEIFKKKDLEALKILGYL